jgi:hypothetical protein
MVSKERRVDRYPELDEGIRKRAKVPPKSEEIELETIQLAESLGR